MAIELKATLQFNSNQQILKFTDITGADNIYPSTKYSTGSTNPNRLLSAVNHIDFVLTNPDYLDSSVIIPTVDLTSYYSNGKELVSGNFNYTDGFEVGIYKVKAYVWFLIDTTDGSDFCTLTSSTQLSAVFAGNNFDSVRNGFSDTKIVKVVQGSNSAIRTITSTNGSTATFSQPLPSSFSLNTLNVLVYAGYEITLSVLSDIKFLKCFQPKIAKVSIQENDCCPRCKSDDVSSLNSMFLGLFSVYAQVESELYSDANSNIKTLLKICNADNCKC